MSKNSLQEAIAGNVIRLLREKRKERGLSMNELAQRSGLSHSIISLVERDLRNPSLDTLLRVAEVLDVDLGQVLTQARDTARKQAKKWPVSGKIF